MTVGQSGKKAQASPFSQSSIETGRATTALAGEGHPRQVAALRDPGVPLGVRRDPQLEEAPRIAAGVTRKDPKVAVVLSVASPVESARPRRSGAAKGGQGLDPEDGVQVSVR